MATLPAQADGQTADAASGSDVVEVERGDVGRRIQDVLEGLGQLNVIRQLGLLIGLSASIALGIVMALWIQDPDYRLLASDLDAAGAQNLVEVLDGMEARYRLDLDEGALWVSESDYDSVKMRLAGMDMLGRRDQGYEILDEQSGFPVSQLRESTMHRRALEGELARTVSSLMAVRSARVHLAIPRTSAFIRNRVPPSASVTLTTVAGMTLAPNSVRAIQNLVSAAVPDMSPADVKVVDQQGLLTSGEENPAESETDLQFEHKQRVERELLRKIDSVLVRLVGEGRFTAEVNAEIDFTRAERTGEIYNPGGRAVRSEFTTQDDQVGMLVDGGIAGALTNVPPAVSQAPETEAGAEGEGGPQQLPTRNQRQSTVNYEVDRTVEYVQDQLARIARITVTVAVDDRIVPAGRARGPAAPAEGGSEPEGAATTAGTGEAGIEPWSREALDDLRLAVQGVIGFDAARNDSVTIINEPFAPALPDPPAPPFWEEAWFGELLRQIGIGIALLLLVFMVIRPLFRELANGGRVLRQSQLDDDDPDFHLDLADPKDLLSIGSSDSPLRLEAELSYANQLDAVRSMVAENPTRVAQVMKNWVGDDE